MPGTVRGVTYRNEEEPHADLARTIWALWPWMSWFLALFIPFHGFILGNGGWETLFLLMYSPILVPLLGLLGVAPRFILRRRGHRSVTASVAWLIVVQWVALLIVALSVGGATDAEPLPSGLSMFTGQPMTPQVEVGFFLSGAAVACATWLMVVILSFFVKPLRGTRREVWWIRAAAMTAVGCLLGAPFLASFLSQQERDDYGATYREVRSTPIDTQLKEARDRYQELQEEFAEIRMFVSADDWVFTENDLEEDELSIMDGYTISLEAETSLDAVELDEEALAEFLKERGYELSSSWWRHPDGRRLWIGDFTEEVSIRMISPQSWGNVEELYEALGVSGDREPSYPADRYPELGIGQLPDSSWDTDLTKR